jgi:hypothetical protein
VVALTHSLPPPHVCCVASAVPAALQATIAFPSQRTAFGVQMISWQFRTKVQLVEQLTLPVCPCAQAAPFRSLRSHSSVPLATPSPQRVPQSAGQLLVLSPAAAEQTLSPQVASVQVLTVSQPTQRMDPT